MLFPFGHCHCFPVPALIKTSTYTRLDFYIHQTCAIWKTFLKEDFLGPDMKTSIKTFFAFQVIDERGSYWPTTIMGFLHFNLNQIRNIDALSCTGCLLTQLLVNNITFPASIILHNPVCSLHKSSSSILKLLHRFQNIHYIVMGDWTDCKKCRWGSQKMRWKAGHPVLSHAENGMTGNWNIRNDQKDTR